MFSLSFLQPCKGAPTVRNFPSIWNIFTKRKELIETAWEYKHQTDFKLRFCFQALTIDSSKAVKVKGITIKNSQQMNFVISRSDSVRIYGVQVAAPEDSPNTDGIHLTQSTNVVIQDCKIGTGSFALSTSFWHLIFHNSEVDLIKNEVTFRLFMLTDSAYKMLG